MLNSESAVLFKWCLKIITYMMFVLMQCMQSVRQRLWTWRNSHRSLAWIGRRAQPYLKYYSYHEIRTICIGWPASLVLMWVTRSQFINSLTIISNFHHENLVIGTSRVNCGPVMGDTRKRVNKLNWHMYIYQKYSAKSDLHADWISFKKFVGILVY